MRRDLWGGLHSLWIALGIALPITANAQTKGNPEVPISSSKLYSNIEYANINLDQGLKPKVVILLDGSGSMGGILEGQKSKMHFAKKLFGTYMRDQWREKAEVGMIVYGSRRKNDCKDYFFAIPFGEKNLTRIEASVKKIAPTGMTPIADSLEMAINSLKKYPGPKRIMIFTDGEETCGGDSCKLLEKAIQDKVFDLEMFVTGIGMKEKSKDLDNLRCLGKTFGATNENELNQALNDINNMMGMGKNGDRTKNNLFVETPSGTVSVSLYRIQNGKKEYLRNFNSTYGVKIPPGEYSADVMIDPVFTFPKFTIPPNKVVTLKVAGIGNLKVNFFDQLLDVEILDRNKKVVSSFSSDTEQAVKTGVYDVHITANPFFELYERNVKITPGGNQRIDVITAGVVQIDYPSVVGVHVYTANEKEVGKYLTNYPFVLKTGTYRFYINDRCNITGIQVKAEKTLKRLGCP
jgi:Ca-activated chloride channel family protein